MKVQLHLNSYLLRWFMWALWQKMKKQSILSLQLYYKRDAVTWCLLWILRMFEIHLFFTEHPRTPTSLNATNEYSFREKRNISVCTQILLLWGVLLYQLTTIMTISQKIFRIKNSKQFQPKCIKADNSLEDYAKTTKDLHRNSYLDVLVTESCSEVFTKVTKEHLE